MEKYYMTKAGYEKLKKELDVLDRRLKGEVAQEIATAREKGDLKENAEYEAAKSKQASLAQRYNDIAQRLTNSRVIDPKDTPPEIVSLGKKVTLRDLDNNDEFFYIILGDGDMDIEKNIISYKSPLAKGLIGHKADEEVEVQLPRGMARYKILSIEFAE